MIVLSILWVPVVSYQQGGQLYIYIQAVAAYLAPPIASIYLLAILWKRCNETVYCIVESEISSKCTITSILSSTSVFNYLVSIPENF